VADRIRFDGHVEAGLEIAQRILSRLRFSSEDRDQILRLIANHMKFKDASAMRESTLKRFVRQPAFDEHLELHRLDCLSSNGQLDSYELVKRKRAEYSEEQLKPPPLVTGWDLIEWGYLPGPQIGSILAAVEDAQLEGAITSIDAARKMIEERFPKP
jgi:hypothetical protein